MYRRCIFCSAALGANETLGAFPVGKALAFDAHRGRLWAVCPRCARWNLAPIEERWEATEDAEKQFRDSRLRVHSENIGLARMPDGTRLIRVGAALPRELAAWRYGDQLVRRRRQALLWGGVGAAGLATVAFGGLALAGTAGLLPLLNLAVNGGSVLNALWLVRNQKRTLHRVPAAASPTGEELRVTLERLNFARVVPASGGGLALELPDFGPMQRTESGGVVRWVRPAPVHLEGELVRRVLETGLARANARGATPRLLDGAWARISAAGSPDALLARIGEQEAGIFRGFLATNQNATRSPRGAWRRFVGTFRGERIAGGTPLPPVRRLSAEDALALEMTLHEASERRALEGELAALEARWREAEEIAAIADRLPDDPLERLREESR